MLKTMCEEVGISGKKTNHSLQAYAATELFNAGIPEKVIQNRTGHRSIKGLCKYERISEKQKKTACKALAVRSPDNVSLNAVQSQFSNDSEESWCSTRCMWLMLVLECP